MKTANKPKFRLLEPVSDIMRMYLDAAIFPDLEAAVRRDESEDGRVTATVIADWGLKYPFPRHAEAKFEVDMKASVDDFCDVVSDNLLRFAQKIHDEECARRRPS